MASINCCDILQNDIYYLNYKKSVNVKNLPLLFFVDKYTLILSVIYFCSTLDEKKILL